MAAAALLVLTLLAGGPAWAESPIGVWRYDLAAMEVEADRMAEALAARMAPQAQAAATRLPRLEQQAAAQRRRAGNDPGKLAQAEQMERMVAQMRAMSADPKGFYKAMIVASYSDPGASIELAADGRVVMTNPALPEAARLGDGTWRQEGRRVTLTFPMPAQAAAGGAAAAGLSGTLAAGRLVLGWSEAPVAGEDPGLEAMMGQMRIHLVRR